MPELPEVETVRRAMEAALPGRIIQQVDTSNKRLREKIDRRRLQALRGDRFVAARRRAAAKRGGLVFEPNPGSVLS